MLMLPNKINNSKTRPTFGFLADIVVSGNARLVLESFRRVADTHYRVLILRVTVGPPAVFRRVTIEPVHVDVLVQTKPVVFRVQVSSALTSTTLCSVDLSSIQCTN